MPLLPSTSPYDEPTREQLVELLNGLALDALALTLIVWRAHRNLSGPLFGDLHGLFGELYGELDGWADRLSEASAQLGGEVVGTAEQVAERNRIDDYPLEVTGGMAHCREIADRIGQLSGWVAQGIQASGKLGAVDFVTLLAKFLRKLNVYGWKVGRYVAPTVPADDAAVQPLPNEQAAPGGQMPGAGSPG